MGSSSALLVQVLASVLLHIGKPTGEIYGSIVGGLLWGLLAYRTRSLLSGMLQHFLLGIALDWFICHA
jgi:membrane protease YdiL (CAAX protease family)